MNRIAVVLVVLAACAAPPMGLGMGARMPISQTGHSVLAGSVGMGAGPGRQTFQAEAQGQFAIARWFALEMGGVYTQLAARSGGKEFNTLGGFPYVRPRFRIDRVSIAVALSGFGFGGGGGGFIGGVADAQVGYGTGTWSVYGGAMAHGFELVSEQSLETSSRALRVGGEYTTRVGRSRLGIAVEVYRQHDDLRRGGTRIESQFMAAALKLSITSPEFR
ncbi:MAG: hypothetical protein K8W52_05950 [Deltaproteobacteria bacterium]|nr:hypothetical protein [Deltaproteobacteria bacterium]